MNLADFFAMGGYAFYVWTSYGIVFIVLLLNVLYPLIQQRRVLRAIRRRQRRYEHQVISE